MLSLTEPPHIVPIQLNILMPVGYGNGHRRQGKDGVGDRAQANGEHVVTPDGPAHEPDGDTGEDHYGVAVQRLAGERGQYLRYYAHCRENQYVHLRVSEDPEEVLPQHNVGACVDVEEVHAEFPVEEELNKADGYDRECCYQKEGGDQRHPDEDWHPHEGHTGRPHIDYGHNEVEGSGHG